MKMERLSLIVTVPKGEKSLQELIRRGKGCRQERRRQGRLEQRRTSLRVWIDCEE